ncbi:hypothetical protein BCR33DRAFT_13535 [Rhizoclosmatium globosum]|uniref:Uncharacterized protein n=1 Tax=Rhizoclosmatium globosum TaxID=329046 RepID=A0A1Y2CPK8_9FUNG|nr:hypothetical protein BCR33DRAFT_13535 [Rhizoclosmatium globosum]|eukprot:ORY48907.1 hypothetical protein BCR33DRAFT_13535 [Rhizoclosmatium globosum]
MLTFVLGFQLPRFAISRDGRRGKAIENPSTDRILKTNAQSTTPSTARPFIALMSATGVAALMTLMEQRCKL